MKFNSRQILLVTVALAITTVLFVLGYKTPFGKSSPKGVSVFNAEDYLSAQKKQLAPGLQKQIGELEAGKDNKENLVKLSTLWDSLNVAYAGAYYALELARREQNEITWFAAGSKFYNAANFSNDSNLTIDAIGKAKEAYGKVLELNPKNLQAKCALAACIIQGDNDVMKGVGMLKEVVAVDSNNVQAIFALGMLSIQSGQFDKAQERFEKLIKIEPFNPEFYYYLGEVYAKRGDVPKAVKTYETCKTLLKDNEARKEIETIINKLNKL